MQTSLEGKAEKISAEDVRKALHGKYRAQNYLKFEEFDEYASGRRIDFMAVSRVRSRPGIHGIEIKVNRSDWLHELNTPKKADAFYFCDFYYLASPPGIWQNGEVPLTWGILQYNNGKIKVIRDPTKLDSKYDFMFLKTLIGRTLKPDVSELQKSNEEAYNEGYKEGQKSHYAAMDYESIKQELKIYKDNFDKFKSKSGIDLFSIWELGKVGELVRKVKDKEESESSIERYQVHLKHVIDNLSELRDKLDGDVKQ